MHAPVVATLTGSESPVQLLCQDLALASAAVSRSRPRSSSLTTSDFNLKLRSLIIMVCQGMIMSLNVSLLVSGTWSHGPLCYNIGPESSQVEGVVTGYPFARSQREVSAA